MKRKIRYLKWKKRLFSCGRDVRFSSGVTIRHPDLVSVGDKVTFSENVHIVFHNVSNVIQKDHKILEVGSGTTLRNDVSMAMELRDRTYSEPLIEIGKNVWIGSLNQISSLKKIIIEDEVLTAANVFISDHDHEYRDISVSVMRQHNTEGKEIRIGKGSWIGRNVCILPGATIGKHCVIGSNSVVLSEIPDLCMAAGTPARVIRKYDHDTDEWVRVKG